MTEQEDSTTNKRKASPELTPEEDGAGKRVKLQAGDENAPPSNGADGGAKEAHEGATPMEMDKEQEAPHTEGSPPRTRREEREPQPRHSPEARRPSATAGPPSRRNVSLEEKKRGQRLFGGLVSALSRPASGTQQQKRLEIERRQQEKAQQRRAEDEKRRAERLDQLKRTREIEQVKLDERAMKTRHRTMLARAHSLHTRSEPKLYYLPWELTSKQEEIISDQIRTAEEAVDRERRDFKTRKEQRLRALGVTPPPRSPSPPPRQQKQPPPPPQEQKPETESSRSEEDATVGEPKPPPQDTNPDSVAPAPKARTTTYHHDKDHDENGDEMVQDEEDVVIY